MLDPVIIGDATLYCGDCLEVMRGMEADSVDAIVTDPPYGLEFMGKEWDHGCPGVSFWQTAIRVAKPGAYLLAFGGTRTFHRLACAIEDAGWEIRDTIMWVYGSGFPKSLDVSKAIDKAAGVRRKIVGEYDRRGQYDGCTRQSVTGGKHDMRAHVKANVPITAPSTDAAKQWSGWGTALKPAWEPVIVARKPLQGTVAENVLRYGCGGLNIDQCRIGTEARTYKGSGAQPHKLNAHGKGDTGIGYMDGSGKDLEFTATGRWPSNLIHDGSEEVVGLFPQSKSCDSPSTAKPESKYRPGQGSYQPQGKIYPGDTGSAARFFYCAKASKQDRDEGCEGMEERERMTLQLPASEFTDYDGQAHKTNGDNRYLPRRNHHPTVKPTDLMRYLCRLVTPPGGVVLDPFMGSGSTGKAAALEGFRFIGIERETDYLTIARKRIEAAQRQGRMELDRA